MKKKTLHSCLFLAFLFSSFQTSSQTTWEKLFSKKSTDSFRTVLEVPSGGYLLAGYTSDSTVSDTDAYVVRMTTAGDTLWTRRIDGAANGKQLIYKAINTGDGGFAFCGYSTNNGPGNDDAYFLKMDANGVIQWSNFWGGQGRDRAQDIVQTPDGGYAIAGYTNSAPAGYYDALLIRLNSSGDTLWTKRYGNSGFDDANTLVMHPDGGFVLGGQSSNGAAGLDMYMVRVNSNGDVLWSKKFGTNSTDNIEHIIRQSDGNYIIAGGTDDLSGLGGNDGSLVKTDSGGTVLWSKKYGGNSQDDFHQVYQTGGGNFILSGTSRSSGPLGPNMWLFKTNSSGDSLWSRTFGGDNHDHGYSAVQTADGGYIFAGYSGSFGFNAEDAYVVKTDNAGNIGDFLTYATVSDFTQPLDGSCTSSNVQLKVVVRNHGRDTLPSVPVTIQITGPITQTLNQTYSGSVRPQDLDTLTFSTLVNLSIPGQYTFSCTSGNLNDVYPQNNNLTKTVNIVAYSATPSTIDSARCGTGSVVLKASSTDSIFWYNASSGGNLLGVGSTFNTPSISSTTLYYAQAGLNCPSARVATTANVLTAPAAPVSVSGQRCGTGSVSLSASAADPIRWFTASSGGTSIGSGNSFNTPAISSTTVYYAEAFNAGCGSARTPATATINPVSGNPVTTSAGRCDSGSITLTATASDPITWYDSAVAGNVVGTGSSFITPSLTSTTTYYAEASNGTCPSNRIAATATVSSQVPDPLVITGSNCGAGTVTLGATSNDILIWYASASGGSQLGSGTSFTTPFITGTTTYYVLATNGACPSNYIPVTATIFSNPSVNIGPDTSIAFGETYLLDAGAGFASYSWTGGSTSQTLTVSSTNTYCVTVTDTNGCSATDCALVQVSVGVNENFSEKNFSIYPNPFGDLFYFVSSENISEALFEIMSIDGRIILQQTIKDIRTGSAIEFNTSNYSPGIYLFRITSDDRSTTRRIIRK
jgi:hypothetical protein